MYRNLEQLLLKACQRKDVTSEYDYVCSFYKDDFQQEVLRAQLLTFGIDFQRIQSEAYGEQKYRKPTIFDIKEYFTSLTSAQKSLLSQVCRVIKLVLVMPATNAT